MNDVVVGITLRADSQGFVGEVRLSQQELDKLNRAGRSAGEGLERSGRQARQAGRQYDDMRGQAAGVTREVQLLQRAVVALGGAMAVRQIVQYADAWTAAGNSLRVATGSAERAAEVQERLFEVSQRTRTQFASNVQLYQRLALAQDQLGASGQDLIDVTEAVGLAVAISGRDATSAAGAIQQLGQALGGTYVRAEEFNSIQDGAPQILKAAASEIDRYAGNVSAMRAEILEGTLTSEEFFQALLSALPELREQFGQTEATIGQAMTVLSDSLGRQIGLLDDHTSASQGASQAIQYLAENMGTVVDVAGDAAIVLGSVLAGRTLVSLAGAFTGAGAAAAGLVRILGGPYSAVIAGVITAVGLLGSNLGRSKDATTELEEASQSVQRVLDGQAGAHSKAGEAARKQALDALTAARTQIEAIKEVQAARERVGAGNGAVNPEGSTVFDRQIAHLEEKAAELRGKLETLAAEAVVEDAITFFQRFGDSADDAAGSTEDLSGAVQKLRDSAFPAQAELNKLGAASATLQKAVAQGVITHQEAEEILSALEDQYGDTEDAADSLTGAMERQVSAGQEAIRQLQEELRLSQMTARARAQEEAVLRAQNAAMERGNLLRPEQIRQIRQLAGAIYDSEQAADSAGDATDDARQAYREFGDEAERVGEQVGERFTDNIIDAMDDGLSGAGDLFDRWLRSLAATALNNAIVVPVSTQIVGAAPGLFGIDQPGGGSGGQGAAGAGQGVGMAQAGSSFWSGIQNGFFSPSVSAQGLANFAPGVFGTSGAVANQAASSTAAVAAQGGVGNFAAQPATVAGTVPNSTANLISQSINPASMIGGFAGSMLSSQLFEGGNPYVRSGLSAAGGFGGALAGTAALTPVLGPFAPVVGAFLGAFGGDALGSLFGGSVPNRAINRKFNFQDGSLTQTGGGEDEATDEQTQAFDQLSEAIRQTVNGIFAGIDATVEDAVGFSVSATRREGPRVSFGDLAGGLPNNAQLPELESVDQATVVGLARSLGTAELSGVSDDTRSNVRDAALLGVESADSAEGVRQLIDRVQELGITTEELLGRVEFAANFEQRIRGLSEGVEDLSETVAGAQVDQLSGIAGRLGEFLDRTSEIYGSEAEELTGRERQAQSAVRSFLERQLGIVEEVTQEQMTAFEQGQLRLRTTIEEIQDPTSEFAQILQRVGISAEEATTALQEQIDENDARRSALLGLEVEGLSDAGDQILGLASQAEVLSRDVEAGRLSAEDFATILESRLAPAIQGLAQEDIDALVTALGPLAEDIPGLSEVLGALDDAVVDTTESETERLEAERERRRDLLRGLEDELDATREARDGWLDLAETLRESIQGLRQDAEISPLNPRQRLQELRGQYEDTRRLALEERDQDAIRELPEISQQYLDALKAYSGDFSAYRTEFERVEASLREARQYSERQASDLEQMVVAGEAAADRLEELLGITATDQSLQDLIDAVNGLDTGGDGTNGSGGTRTDEEGDPLLTGATGAVADLYRGVLGRDPDDSGFDYWQGQYQGGMSLSEIRRRMNDSDEARGFALGGYHPGGLRMVGEMGPELEVTGPARYYSNTDTMAMLRQSMGGPAADVSPIVDAAERTVVAVGEVAAQMATVVDRLERIEAATHANGQEIERLGRDQRNSQRLLEALTR